MPGACRAWLACPAPYLKMYYASGVIARQHPGPMLSKLLQRARSSL
jgi:hypothetical protein